MPDTDRPAARVLHAADGLSLHLTPGDGAAGLLVLAADVAALAWAGRLAARMGRPALALHAADGLFPEAALAQMLPPVRDALADRPVLLGAGAAALAAFDHAGMFGAAGVLAVMAPGAAAGPIAAPSSGVAVMVFDPSAAAHVAALPEGILPVPMRHAGAALADMLLAGGALPDAIDALLAGDAPRAAMALRVARLAPPRMRKGLAERLAASGHARLAEAVLALDIRPWAPDAQADARVRTLQRLGRHAEAITPLRDLVRRQPRQSLPRRRLAAAHAALGQPGRAVTALLGAGGLAPLPVALQARLVRMLVEARRHDEAVAAAEALVAAVPGTAMPEALLGEALLAAGRRAAAADAFGRALAVDPADGTARRGLAVAGDGGGRDDGPDEVLGAFLDAMAAAGAPEDEWQQVIDLLRARDRPVAALAAATRALEAVPSAGLAARIAQVHQDAGRMAEAEAAWRRAIALAPEDAAPWLALVDLLAASKRPEQAAAVATEAAARHPDEARVARRCAELLMASADAIGAERQARRAIVIDGRDVAAHLLLADALWRQHRGRDAVRAAEAGLAAVPDSQPLRLRLGFLHLLQGVPAAAAAVFRDAVRQPRSTAEAWLGLTDALWRAGEVAEAEAAAREGLVAFPRHVQLRTRLGQLLLAGGDAEAARTALAEVMAEDPGSELVQLAVADALWRQGRRAEALAAAREVALALPDDPAVAARLGHLLLETGDVDEAAAQFARAIAVKPELVSAWTGLCDAERVRKRIKPAIEAYRRAEALGMDRMTRRMLRFRLFGEFED
jgi:tetratricopeptide (TPR) repeat protein